MSAITVAHFTPQFVSDFVRLNREWIEHYFEIEKMDLVQLENPEETIIKKGGEIFFVLENGSSVMGVCAMVPHGIDCYEIAKMAVDKTVRGKGYGDLLMEAAISWGEEKGAKKILILSNTILAPAISLYRKHGFIEISRDQHEDYKRCNIVLERNY